MTMQDYSQWQESPVITSLKANYIKVKEYAICNLNHFTQKINKPVKDTPFPSITICTEGINMDAVMEAVTKDFNEWLKNNRNKTVNDKTYTEEKHGQNVKDFLFDFYSINPSYDISIEDIVLSYSSPEPDKYIHKYF